MSSYVTRKTPGDTAWFTHDRFGMFIHWGLYAMPARHEWIKNRECIPEDHYDLYFKHFDPDLYDPKAWARQAKAAGMKYVVLTTKHHEGFCMFDSQYTDYKCTNTPAGRDLVREYVDAFRAEGLHIGFYYSLIDWWREDAPRGRTGLGTGRPAEKEDADAYFDFMKAQLTELLTQYGDVGAIWFDGIWDQDENPGFDWRLGELYGLIHKLQPGCLIINNHHLAPFEGEDAQAFERDLPGENTAGYSGQEISRLPLETCQTMNGMWGYKITDQNYKSAQTLVRYLAGAAGRGANLLLNIGPQPDGALPAAALERLDSMGRWLRANGETIYGTQAGPVSPRSWGVTTRRGDKIYVHILDWPDEELFVPVRDERIRQAVRFADKRAVAFSQDKAGVTLRLGEKPAGADCIVELTVGK